VCCSVLQCVVVCCSVLQCVVTSYTHQPKRAARRRHFSGRQRLWCVAACCSVLQFVAVYCNVSHPPAQNALQGGGVSRENRGCSMLQYVAVCCSMLQCVAVCCSVLQCVTVCHTHQPKCAARWWHFAGIFVAVCCSVLQHVAVCCSVLQCVAVSYTH